MKTDRPLNEKELKTLSKQKKEISRFQSRWNKFLFIWMAGCLCAGMAVGVFVGGGNLIPAVGSVLAVTGIGLWIFFEERGKERKNLKQINYLIQKNVVTSIRVQSTEFYKLEEQEDEGVYYLFQITPDTMFGFGGQEFYPTKKFPSTDFEIVEGRDDKGSVIFFKLYVSGEKIKPLKKIKGEKKWEVFHQLKLDEHRIIPGRLEQFNNYFL